MTWIDLVVGGLPDSPTPLSERVTWTHVDFTGPQKGHRTRRIAMALLLCDMWFFRLDEWDMLDEWIFVWGVINGASWAYPRLPNTLWGGIWTPKTYLKHLLRRYLEAYGWRNQQIFGWSHEPSSSIGFWLHPWKINMLNPKWRWMVQMMFLFNAGGWFLGEPAVNFQGCTVYPNQKSPKRKRLKHQQTDQL